MKSMIIVFALFGVLKVLSTAKASEFEMLCTDMAREQIENKIQFVQQKNFAHSQKKVQYFMSLPAVIDPQLDYQFLKVVGQKKRLQAKAKFFDDKMLIEEKSIQSLQRLMKKPKGQEFIKHCAKLYKFVKEGCDSYLAKKDFNGYSQCSQRYLGKNSEYLANAIPFVQYMGRKRALSSVKSK